MNAWLQPRFRTPLVRAGQVALTLVVFAVFNAIGGWFELSDGVSILYPATAVSVVACMTFGPWAALGVVLGTILTPWSPTASLRIQLLSGLIIAAQGLIPWFVFKVRGRLSPDLRDMRSLSAFLLWGAVLNTGVTAVVGNLLVIPHPPAALLLWRNVFVWWIADFVAALLLAMPILAFGGALVDRSASERPRTITNVLQIVSIVILLGFGASIAIRAYLLNRLESERMTQHKAWTTAQHKLNLLHSNLLRASSITPGEPDSTVELQATRRIHERLVRELGAAIGSGSPELAAEYPRFAASTRRWLAPSAQSESDAHPRTTEPDLARMARSVLALHGMIDVANAREQDQYIGERSKIITVTTLVDGTVFLTVVFAAVILLYTISRPFAQLRAALASMQHGEALDVMRIDSRYAEFRSIAQALEETSLALRAREEELRTQTDKALQASRHKSEFLAKMSHELRTPLNSIIGFADLLSVQEATISPEKRLGFLKIVSSSAGHLLSLINDLLDIAKVESGKLQLQFDTIDLRMSVANTVSSVLPLFQRKNQTVEVETPSEPMMVRADASRIEQVFLNLLSNANKFSHEGQRITVRGTAEETMCSIEVIDEGIGIRPEDVERIFQDFEQVRAAGSSSGGTGLGLALVRRLVRAHGGEVEVESRPGHGSSFRVRLPRV